MYTYSRYILGLAIAIAMLAAPRAEAAIRIYKVTIVQKAVFFKENSITSVGYLIYDTTTPANSQTVEVFKNKTYATNGDLLQYIFPSQVALGTLDKNDDNVMDTEFALVGFQTGANPTITQSRAYIGPVPKNGFRIGNTTFFQTAKALKGVGGVNVPGLDYFVRADSLKIDPLSGANPADTNAGITLVTAQLAAKGYSEVN